MLFCLHPVNTLCWVYEDGRVCQSAVVWIYTGLHRALEGRGSGIAAYQAFY